MEEHIKKQLKEKYKEFYSRIWSFTKFGIGLIIVLILGIISLKVFLSEKELEALLSGYVLLMPNVGWFIIIWVGTIVIRSIPVWKNLIDIGKIIFRRGS